MRASLTGPRDPPQIWNRGNAGMPEPQQPAEGALIAMDTRPESRRRIARDPLLLFAAILAAATGACQADADPVEPEVRDPLNALVLPDEPFDYEGVVIPAHFRSNDFPSRFSHQSAATDHDNEPARNPVTTTAPHSAGSSSTTRR